STLHTHFHASTPVSISLLLLSSCFFFFNDPATTEIYTLSLHDALPIFSVFSLSIILRMTPSVTASQQSWRYWPPRREAFVAALRSEEHTSELQSLTNLVCRLLLEKKKHRQTHTTMFNDL